MTGAYGGAQRYEISVRGALPGLPRQQARRRMQQEPRERAVGFGQVQRALHRPRGGARVAECVPSDRLQQERLNQPGPPAHPGGAVQDRREHLGHGTRVVLGEPQRRGGETHLPPIANAFAEAGQDLLGVVEAQDRKSVV